MMKRWRAVVSRHKKRFCFLALVVFLIIIAAIVAGIVLNRKKPKTLNVAAYWGQGGLSQVNLGYLCQTEPVDIVILGFVTRFPQQSSTGFPTTNFGNGCINKKYKLPNGTATGLNVNCPSMVSGISICQGLGIKVLLSLGGAYVSGGNASVTYNLTGMVAAYQFADFLWSAFGPLNASSTIPRPFANVSVDGFDLDIEGGQGSSFQYLIDRLQQHYATANGTYYTSASPRCGFPDPQLSVVLTNSWIDFVWPRFYNSKACGIGSYLNKTGGNFTLQNWLTGAKTFFNPNAQIYLGITANPNSSDYTSAAALKPVIQQYQNKQGFGGVMMWDLNTASVQNVINGVSYLRRVRADFSS